MTNVVLVVADDLGYSDLGCYGGEIRTPRLDRIGRNGVRLNNFYNTARCSPSRASLLTGLHPHRTGIGVLTSNDAPRGYLGSLNDSCLTAAEVFADGGYRTGLSGKWHLSSQVWEADDSWPTRRGFQHFYGTISGCGSYYAPSTLTVGEENADARIDPGFFYTDSIADDAVAFIDREAGSPFFLYVAFTAPHWPLHAAEDEIASYDGVYDVGWDELRRRRLDRMTAEGVLPVGTALSDRDPAQPAWEDTDHRDWEVRRMQTYAAMVERMDAGVGRIEEALRRHEVWDDTLFVFLSDNGASAEEIGDDPEYLAGIRARPEIFPSTTRDGREVRIGNRPSITPGAEDTYASYGQPWANLSNTPFRFYKRWVHEGGIATPFLAHWPDGGLATGTVVSDPAQLVDVLPTLLDATGVPMAAQRRGVTVPEPAGTSLLGALRGAGRQPRSQYWEHIGNAAVRDGRWKLVREYPGPWELYDLQDDRTELHDLSDQRPDLVEALASRWSDWASVNGVKPWDEVIALYRDRGQTSTDAKG
ncbi:arylsulfatase [Tsukamurella spumae]|uniref:Arylsulfatase n=1 Tax=Tsukamurella spumae TaxID=44753 RepID=A0A846WYT7_9ACTN|nr:arylsulfatase [Tsukamurella spumae]NKY17182.1 arylsulfatase [Tsukamurella spumae]